MVYKYALCLGTGIFLDFFNTIVFCFFFVFILGIALLCKTENDWKRFSENFKTKSAHPYLCRKTKGSKFTERRLFKIVKCVPINIKDW